MDEWQLRNFALLSSDQLFALKEKARIRKENDTFKPMKILETN